MLATLELDVEAQTFALDLMRKRRSGTVSLASDSLPVFFEVHGPPPTLIVFGAGHVSMPLISLAHDLGLKTYRRRWPSEVCDARAFSRR